MKFKDTKCPSAAQVHGLNPQTLISMHLIVIDPNPLACPIINAPAKLPQLFIWDL